MIHATVPGVLITEAVYVPAERDHDRGNQAAAFFQISSRRGADQTQVVECAFRGRGAEIHHRALCAGRHVIVTGALHLAMTGGRPRLVLAVQSLEFIGSKHPEGRRFTDQEEA